jgi:hypothetical protein
MSGSAEVEAPKLAAELGCTLYEARLRIVAPKPLVLLQTDDPARASDLAGAMNTRQHAATVVDAREVPASESMVEMDHFHLGVDSVELRGGKVDPLGYDDVVALLPAVHRQTTTDSSPNGPRPAKPKMFSTLGKLGKPAGPVEERTHVVYMYSRLGRPWLLRESAQTAGPVLALGRFQSFRAVTNQLRHSCSRAVWDERLLRANVPDEPVSSSSAYHLVSNVRANDLLAFALASWITSGRDNPYRG